MGNLWEFFFCPVHGIFAPANWQFILPALGGAAVFVRGYWERIRGLFK